MRRSCRMEVGLLALLLLTVLAWPLASDEPPPDPLDCSTGVVKDDGDPESGYGFVPSAKMGSYVQKFNSAEFPRRQLSKVCLCMLKTRGESDAEVEVVFHQQVGPFPSAQPYAAVRGTLKDLPRSKEEAGRYYEFDVTGVTLPEGVSYVGVRWDPSVSKFLFICNDQTPETQKVDVFFREDKLPRWAHVDESPDPIFRPHRSILVRAVAASEEQAASPRFLTGPASSTPQVRYRKEP